MIPVLFSTLITQIANPELPKLNPFLEIRLPEKGQGPREIHGPIPVVPTHVFIDEPTKTLIVLYDPDGLSLYELPTGKLRQTYALAQPHPFHVEYQDSVLTFFNGSHIRTFDLKTEIENREPDKNTLPLGARLIANQPQYGTGLLKNVQTAHLYTQDRFVQIDQPKEKPDYDFGGHCDFVIRAYPSGNEISRRPVPHITSLLDTYLTADHKTIGIQSPYQKAIFLYSVPEFKRIGKVHAADGKFAFDTNGRWAVGFGRHHGLSLLGEWPELTDIKSGRQFQLDYSSGDRSASASAGAVSAKLGIAAIANEYRMVYLYHLPK